MKKMLAIITICVAMLVVGTACGKSTKITKPSIIKPVKTTGMIIKPSIIKPV